jgi:hypothetical protein
VSSDAAPSRDASEAAPDAGSNAADAGRPPPSPTEPRSSAEVFYLGHSLQNWTVPSMVDSFADASSVTHEFEAAIGIGASLSWQWAHPENADGQNPRTRLPAKAFDVLVMTEAIPLADQIEHNDSAGHALQFLELAQQANPNVQPYLYETWHSRDEANWRQRLDSDLAAWESIVNDVNAAQDGVDMLLIPGGQALAALYDRIEAGGVPGIGSIDEVFHDHIHLNYTGWYFIACVQYATIFRQSPVGLPVATTDRRGDEHPAPPAGAVPVLQEIAWQAVRSYPRSGVE